MNWKTGLRAAVLGAVVLGAPEARAFCGFYVSGATGELYNNATQVVLMREGTRTVLSMANNYQGPPSDFAMVIPVPVILQKENVKTLPQPLFKKIDELGAPRLVEYWEQDPCSPTLEGLGLTGTGFGGGGIGFGYGAGKGGLGVKVEAQFEVGEYEVVILSAKDSTGLDTWLRQEKYNIPAGAEPVLKPYVQAGMKFFVAKVNIAKVKKDGDKTMLSPLRFHYDTEKFELPVRLGLINSSGKQDLLVHILAKGKRYEVANYPNVTIPTNLDVGEITRDQFAKFYAALFDQTAEKNPKAVITEYAWDASTCDPCPGPTLSSRDLDTLGLDVLPKVAAEDGSRRGYVLTRLHARYGKDTLGEDLVFKEAPAITGGREVRVGGKTLEQGSTKATINNFQGRYAIRHPWKGPVTCKEPTYGRWGGPPDHHKKETRAAVGVAFVPRGAVKLPEFLAQDVPEIDVKGQAAAVSPVPLPSGSAAPTPSAPAPTSLTTTMPSAAPAASAEVSVGREVSKSCACSSPGGSTGRPGGLAGLAALALLALRRRR